MGLFGGLFGGSGGSHRKKGRTRGLAPVRGGKSIGARAQLARRGGGRNPTAKQMKQLWWK